MSSTTLILLLLIGSAMMMLALGLAWLQLGRPRYLLVWTGSYAVSIAQWLVNGAGLAWANAWLLWASGLLMMAAISLNVVAVRMRSGLARPWQPVLLAAGIVAVLVSVVAARGGIAVVLAALIPAYVCACCVATAFALRPRGREFRMAERGYWVVLWAFALFELVVITCGWMAATNRTPETLAMYYAVIGWGLPTLYVSAGIAAVLLAASDRVDALASMVATDPLTGVANRRGLEMAGGKCLTQARRSGRPVTLLACDLDDFKAINDNFGHAVGDEALRLFAAILVRVEREGDVVGRIGGDEFLVVLADADAEQGVLTTERIRSVLSSVHVVGAQGTCLRASFGVAQAHDGDHLSTLIERADMALYASKRAAKVRSPVRATPSAVPR